MATIFQTTFSHDIWIAIDISLKFVPTGPNDNIPSFERRQAVIWTNDGWINDAYKYTRPQ